MKWLFPATLFLLALNFTGRAQSQTDDIIGEWVAPGKNGRILIYKSNNKYFGKITWGKGGPEVDENNPEPALRKRKVIGLEILKDFVFDGEVWTDGTIYDPREGKTYSCKLSLDRKNNLNIRGYVGISLFGRTETWTRYLLK